MQKSDSCKRFCTGVILSLFVIGVMFGCACVFLTNQYKHSGLQQFPDKFSDSLLAITLTFLPFCLTELFALLQFEFGQTWITFLVDKVKLGCQKALDLICGKCSDNAVASFDLLKFLPSNDPTGKDR